MSTAEKCLIEAEQMQAKLRGIFIDTIPPDKLELCILKLCLEIKEGADQLLASAESPETIPAGETIKRVATIIGQTQITMWLTEQTMAE